MTACDGAIEIIIPNWNGKELLAECLLSLAKQTSQEFSVTVVDNGSEDGSVLWLEREYPHVKILRFPENRGFSAAINAGITDSDAQWFLLLNNDIEVAPDCMMQLREAIAAYPDYDSFCIKMLSYHQRHIIDGAGDAVLRGGVGYRLGTLEQDRGQYDNDADVFGACAGAALYSRRFFATVGHFDEDFFAYLEDVDLNMRAVWAGLKCKYLCRAEVYHIGSATTGSKINPVTIRLSTKNNLNILVKNYPASLLLRFCIVIAIYQCMWLLFVLKKGQLLPYIKGLAGAAKQLPLMYKKRRQKQRGKVRSPAEMAKILTASERQAVASICARRASENKSNFLLRLYLILFC